MPIVYEGRVFSVEVDTKRLPNGREHQVEIVRHPPAVVVLPIEDDGRIVLIRQFRPAVGRELWEVPAGSVDEGESADAAAKRECEEEIGRAPRRVERLAALYPAPGYCDEELIFFRATELRAPAPDSPHHPDADEDIVARPFALADALAMVAAGDIVDLKTAYGLTFLDAQARRP
jgi:ADP-ribose diphosphatase